MNFIRDICKWQLINVPNCQYNSFKKIVGNQRNVTMTTCVVGKSNMLYAHGITAIKSSCKWWEIFTAFIVGITSDYSYIFIENCISNMSYLFSYSR